ncbi:MAG: type II toxin-antitoxin system HigB family toxin [Bacteroidales bacterium]|nr:type II toxin-antitoxin system HigB family toxin [Bacteroidales bacterium]
MRVIAKRTLVLYYEQHPDAQTALEEWYEKAQKAEWDTFADVKQTFNSADSVGNRRFVFNIRGNQYRLVALVLFRIKMVYIRFVGTHSEYDKIKDIKNI